MFDQDGDWAKNGRLNDQFLAKLMDEDFLKLPPPKSTGKELFNLSWLRQRLFKKPEMSAIDVQCTLTHFTAKTIGMAVTQFKPQEVIICGGGAHNSFLMNLISEYAKGAEG